MTVVELPAMMRIIFLMMFVCMLMIAFILMVIIYKETRKGDKK